MQKAEKLFKCHESRLCLALIFKPSSSLTNRNEFPEFFALSAALSPLLKVILAVSNTVFVLQQHLGGPLLTGMVLLTVHMVKDWEGLAQNAYNQNKLHSLYHGRETFSRKPYFAPFSLHETLFGDGNKSKLGQERQVLFFFFFHPFLCL